MTDSAWTVGVRICPKCKWPRPKTERECVICKERK